MNGTIPESFGQLSKLIRLNLNENSWEGVVTEAHLMNLKSLEYLKIFTADKVMPLVFNVTHEWVPPFKLKYLKLKNFLVGPRFSMWLQVQSELTYVSLGNVGVADTIPEEWFSKISHRLTYLDLSNNRIKGRLPYHLESPKLLWIDLSNNSFHGYLPLWSTNASIFLLENNLFSGPIPSNIGELMPQLEYLYLHENHLNGTIPSSICTLENLQFLSLRTNQLFGELPQCWNKLQKLFSLDVSNNSLSGKIPNSIGSLSSLVLLLLSSNNLDGEIPPSLWNCTMMTTVDLGGNNLSGKLPSWIGGNGIALKILRLRSNSFNGNIPRQWCNLKELHVLDLAHNNLSGAIPSCLKNLTALVYGSNSSANFTNEKQIIVVAKGRELKYGWTIQFINNIDLSANKLVGEIPKEITSLTALNTLYFSMNCLFGHIPDNIGNLRWLETLVVSSNNLSGPIPQSLSSLTSLAHLNLSHNNLIGKIPSGYQLQTLDDPSIYEGNPLLCGLPLRTKCQGDDASNALPAGNDDDDENEVEMVWFYGSMGLGFVVGFWVFFGTLLIKKSWRHAYIQFLENMIERIALMIELSVARLQRRWDQ
ncbi:receptor-like protein EIX2 [Cornus florida]|uniref:receptor-like protein EIX2 n=1 Tax=Cornus florida TaxID=4283 RepID=UPI002898A42D|nr:receptor-like protein EIX2 [Cornus florida]